MAAAILYGTLPSDLTEAEVTSFLENLGKGQWIGQVSCRYTDRATVTKVKKLEDGEYGPRFLVAFDIGGNSAVWWTGENCWCNEGDECDIRYTVKDHTIYGDTKQTTISRVKREKVIGPGDTEVATTTEQPG